MKTKKLSQAFAVAKRRYLKFAVYELKGVLRFIAFEAYKPFDAVKIFDISLIRKSKFRKI